MSTKSNDQGRAFEFACINTLFNAISKIRKVQIERNSSYFAAEHAWNNIDDILKVEDSINQNLYEDNGWWGFTNNTTIDPKELKIAM